MARILLAWELGSGLGHVVRLAPVARELRDAGHECVFALRNPRAAAQTSIADGFTIVQAPLAVPMKSAGPLGSLGDVLATIGYADPGRLEPLLRGWEGLLSELGIELVVADYAPTACLAALGRTPVVAVGGSFTLPPVHAGHFPPFQPGRA